MDGGTVLSAFRIWREIHEALSALGRNRILVLVEKNTIAIFSSMPAVFILSGVGGYYFLQCLQQKEIKKALKLAIPVACWILCFAFYYYTILKPQAESAYLQNYHADYFLFATPSSREEWDHNWGRIKEIINNAGGFAYFSLWANVILIITGIIYLLRKKASVPVLVFLPFVLTMFAAAIDKFSLIDRVVLFLLPLLHILIGAGYHVFLKPRFLLYRTVIWAAGIKMILGFNMFWLFQEKLGFQEITQGFDYLMQKNAAGGQLYVHDASRPAYLYYTGIHPDREKYKNLLGAHLPNWDDHYANYTDAEKRDTIYLLTTDGWHEGEQNRRFNELTMNYKPADTFQVYVTWVYTLKALAAEERAEARQQRENENKP